jgi:protein-tyrosine phosphatase
MRICFVCSGNICRSPTAEIVLRRMLEQEGLADEIEVCSAGIGDWHIGEGADRRSAAVLSERGYDSSPHRARQWERGWFTEHDLVVAMDESHLRDLVRMAGPAHVDQVRLFTSFGPDATYEDVPDPYYGGPQGFAHVLDVIESGCRALLDDVRGRLPA